MAAPKRTSTKTKTKTKAKTKALVSAVHTIKVGETWHMVANWAGIEWSVQFCCDPAKVDALRQTARAITDAFPQTIPELEALG